MLVLYQPVRLDADATTLFVFRLCLGDKREGGQQQRGKG